MPARRVPWLQGSTKDRDYPWVVLLEKSLEDTPPSIFSNIYTHNDFPVGITLAQALAILWRARTFTAQAHGKIKLHYEGDVSMHVNPPPPGYTGPPFSDFTSHQTYDITIEFTWPEGDPGEDEIPDGIPPPNGTSVQADASLGTVNYEIHWTGINHLGDTDTYDAVDSTDLIGGDCSILISGQTNWAEPFYSSYFLFNDVDKTFWPLFNGSSLVATPSFVSAIPTIGLNGILNRDEPSGSLTGTVDNGTLVEPDVAGTLTVSPVITDDFNVWINVGPYFTPDVYVIQNPVHYYNDDGENAIYGWDGSTVSFDYEFTIIDPFTATFLAQDFRPFLNRIGQEVYDTSDGHQINDPM